MVEWLLRIQVLTPRDRPRLAHVCVLLGADPHVHSFDVSDDPSNPFEVHVRVTFREGHTRPLTPDLQALTPSGVPLPLPLKDLSREAARIEAEYQRRLDAALTEVNTVTDVPGWVRIDRWVRHVQERWTARITEVVPGIVTRVRYVRADAHGLLGNPVLTMLSSFVEEFAPSEKPLPPPSFYQRLLQRRRK